MSSSERRDPRSNGSKNSRNKKHLQSQLHLYQKSVLLWIQMWKYSILRDKRYVGNQNHKKKEHIQNRSETAGTGK